MCRLFCRFRYRTGKMIISTFFRYARIFSLTEPYTIQVLVCHTLMNSKKIAFQD